MFGCQVTSDFATLWTAAHQDSLSLAISQSLPKLMSIESVMPSNHFILSHPLLLPSVFPSIRVFSNELALPIRWPKYWSFSNSLSNEYSGLISFRIDWFDLLAVQGMVTIKQEPKVEVRVSQAKGRGNSNPSRGTTLANTLSQKRAWQKARVARTQECRRGRGGGRFGAEPQRQQGPV